MLLLDEPFRGLDAVSADRLETLLADLADNGRTLLIATHEVAQARRWERVLCLNGRQVAFGPAADVLTAEVLEADLRRDDRRRPRPARPRHRPRPSPPPRRVIQLLTDPWGEPVTRRAFLEIALLGLGERRARAAG